MTRAEQTKHEPAGVVFPFSAGQKKYMLPDEAEAAACHLRLLNDPNALSYITKTRGISIETARHFKIGVKENERTWLSIPHFAGGRLIDVKYRSLPPAHKIYRRCSENCQPILFNFDAVTAQSADQAIILCHGEIDAITLYDQGLRNVIGATKSAGGFDPEWVDALKDLPKIFICYRNDDKNQVAAREVARRLGYDRCFNVKLPEGVDTNDYFRSGGSHGEFSRMVNEARPFDVAGIASFNDCLDEMESNLGKTEKVGLKTGFANVDKLLKVGLKPGYLTILGAPPKIGKTTFALQIATYNALHQVPSLIFCLEMSPTDITGKIVQCHTRSTMETVLNVGGTAIAKTRADFRNVPLYIGCCPNRPTVDGIIETLKLAIRRYGLKLLIFDHLHFLCRSIEHQVCEVGLAVQTFKFLAVELEIPVILIAQPRKIQGDRIMTRDDLKDSSAIAADCDHMILLHRKSMGAKSGGDVSEDMQLSTASFSPITLCKVEVSRFGPGGEAVLCYHGDYSRFDPIAGP